MDPKKLAARYLAASTHAKQVALMKWLGRLVRRLRGPKPVMVGDHIYVVGGAVRNYVIDAPIKDIDIVLDSVALGVDSGWFAKALEREIPAATHLVSDQYGVWHVSIKGDWVLDGQNMRGEDIEIATARREEYGEGEGKGYKPHLVEPTTVEEDVKRREFTFNTLLWRLSDLAEGPDKAEIVDLTGCGLRDLQKGEMRCPSDPDKTFSDDPTRMLRAIKFLTKYGFTIPDDVAASIRRNADKLKNPPHPAISTIITQVLLQEKTAIQALREMKRLGLIDVIRDMFNDIKAFRRALLNHANNMKFEALWEFMDLGFPPPSSMGFLDDDQRLRFREIVVEKGEGFGKRLLDVLRQPGKLLDTRQLIEELNLAPRDRGKITSLARATLLDYPSFLDDPSGLQDSIQADLGVPAKAASRAPDAGLRDFLQRSRMKEQARPLKTEFSIIRPLTSPLFNLREVCKEMSLLEDHLQHPPKECPDCIRKHFLKVEALLEESLNLGVAEPMRGMIVHLVEIWVDLQLQWLDDKEVGQMVRQLRKELTPICFDIRRRMARRVAARYIRRAVTKDFLKYEDTQRVGRHRYRIMGNPRLAYVYLQVPKSRRYPEGWRRINKLFGGGKGWAYKFRGYTHGHWKKWWEAAAAMHKAEHFAPTKAPTPPGYKKRKPTEPEDASDLDLDFSMFAGAQNIGIPVEDPEALFAGPHTDLELIDTSLEQVQQYQDAWP